MKNIDNTVVRGKTEDGTSYAAFQLRVDPRKMFSDYGMEYIREVVKILLTEAFIRDKKPEEFDERIRETVVRTVAKSAHAIAMNEAKKIISEDVGSIVDVFKDVIEGDDGE